MLSDWVLCFGSFACFQSTSLSPIYFNKLNVECNRRCCVGWCTAKRRECAWSRFSLAPWCYLEPHRCSWHRGTPYHMSYNDFSSISQITPSFFPCPLFRWCWTITETWSALRVAAMECVLMHVHRFILLYMSYFLDFFCSDRCPCGFKRQRPRIWSDSHWLLAFHTTWSPI